jgi:hypothetical protein
VKDDSIVNVSVPVDLCTTVSRSKGKKWEKLCVVRHGEIDAVICRYWILLIFVNRTRRTIHVLLGHFFIIIITVRWV